MKRALAVGAAWLMLGATGLGMSISGEWSTEIDILPDIAFEETSLSLTTSVAGWEITSTSEFDPAFTTQRFALDGSLGGFGLVADIAFDPTVPEYDRARLTVSVALLNVAVDFDVVHEKNQLDYTLTAGLSPFELSVGFAETHENSFDYLQLTGSDLPFCCGIDYEFELRFEKHGFEHVELGFTDLYTLMDIASLNADIKYAVGSKTISFDWDIADLPVVACVKLFSDFGVAPWEFEFHGFAITCEFDDCNYLALTTMMVEHASNNGFETYAEPAGQEFESIELGFCGSTCCSEDYELELVIYFWEPEDDEDATLLGLSRLASSFSIPVLHGFVFDIDFGHSIVLDETELTIGWTFTF
ncbi:MAG: hypothetical protein R6U88_04490 [Candidatus Bipolaricaulota bacterium]